METKQLYILAFKSVIFWAIGISLVIYVGNSGNKSFVWDLLWVLSALSAGTGLHFSLLLAAKLTVKHVGNKYKK